MAGQIHAVRTMWCDITTFNVKTMLWFNHVLTATRWFNHGVKNHLVITRPQRKGIYNPMCSVIYNHGVIQPQWDITTVWYNHVATKPRHDMTAGDRTMVLSWPQFLVVGTRQSLIKPVLADQPVRHLLSFTLRREQSEEVMWWSVFGQGRLPRS